MKSDTNQAGHELAVLNEAYFQMYDTLSRVVPAFSDYEDKLTHMTEPEKINHYDDLLVLIRDISQRPSYRGPECWMPYEDLSDTLFLKNGEWDEIEPRMKEVRDALGKMMKDAGVDERVSAAEMKKEIERAKEDSKTIFTVSFPNERVVMVNDFVLARPHFNGVNEKVFSFIFKNQNKRITKEELEAGVKFTESEKGRKTERILRDLGFEDSLFKLFFPHVSISAIYFRNPVTRRVLKNENLTEKEVINTLKSRT